MNDITVIDSDEIGVSVGWYRCVSGDEIPVGSLVYVTQVDTKVHFLYGDSSWSDSVKSFLGQFESAPDGDVFIDAEIATLTREMQAIGKEVGQLRTTLTTAVPTVEGDGVTLGTDDDEAHYEYQGGEIHCAGALIAMHRKGEIQGNFLLRMAIMFGWLKIENLNMSADVLDLDTWIESDNDD